MQMKPREHGNSQRYLSWPPIRSNSAPRVENRWAPTASNSSNMPPHTLNCSAPCSRGWLPAGVRAPPPQTKESPSTPSASTHHHAEHKACRALSRDHGHAPARWSSRQGRKGATPARFRSARQTLPRTSAKANSTFGDRGHWRLALDFGDRYGAAGRSTTSTQIVPNAAAQEARLRHLTTSKSDSYVHRGRWRFGDFTSASSISAKFATSYRGHADRLISRRLHPVRQWRSAQRKPRRQEPVEDYLRDYNGEAPAYRAGATICRHGRHPRGRGIASRTLRPLLCLVDYASRGIASPRRAETAASRPWRPTESGPPAPDFTRNVRAIFSSHPRRAMRALASNFQALFEA